MAALLIGIGAIGGIGTAAWSFATAWTLPVSDHPFGSDTATEVHLQAGQTKVIYAGGIKDPQGTCTAGNGAQLHPYDGDVHVGTWRALNTITADTAGDYELKCTGDDDLTFSVGGDAGPIQAIGLGGAAAGGLCVVAGLILLGITFARRRSNSSSR